jgi:hypothetical protein
MYELLLTVLVFVSLFAICLNFLPNFVSAERQEQLKSGKIRGLDYNMYNDTTIQTLNLTYISVGLLDENKLTVQGEDLFFYYVPFHEDVLFGVVHRKQTFWVFSETHDLEESSGQTTKSDFPYSISGVTGSFIKTKYLNETMGATFEMRCAHVVLHIVMFSNDVVTNTTLPYALTNRQTITIYVKGSLDFATMGANIWATVGALLSFNSFQTQNEYADLLVNGILGFMIYGSIAYLIWRFVIPLLPFGGGAGGS